MKFYITPFQQTVIDEIIVIDREERKEDINIIRKLSLYFMKKGSTDYIKFYNNYLGKFSRVKTEEYSIQYDIGTEFYDDGKLTQFLNNYDYVIVKIEIQPPVITSVKVKASDIQQNLTDTQLVDLTARM